MDASLLSSVGLSQPIDGEGSFGDDVEGALADEVGVSFDGTRLTRQSETDQLPKNASKFGVFALQGEQAAIPDFSEKNSSAGSADGGR